MEDVIDINKVDDDIVEEFIAPENEDAAQMLERLSQQMFWQSIKEIYLKNILSEVQDLMSLEKKTPNDREKLLKYLQAIDSIMWFSKDKRDVKIVTQMGNMNDIFNKIKD